MSSQTSCTSTCFSSIHVAGVEVVWSALLYSEELNPLSIKYKMHLPLCCSKMYWHFWIPDYLDIFQFWAVVDMLNTIASWSVWYFTMVYHCLRQEWKKIHSVNNIHKPRINNVFVKKCKLSRLNMPYTYLAFSPNLPYNFFPYMSFGEKR